MPWDSAPMATSTCEGSSALDVHDDPEETANPARSSPSSTDSPST